MSQVTPQAGMLPSILDRLIDPASAGTSFRPGYSAAQVIASVRRDLEDLLNTRPPSLPIPPDFVEVRRSIGNYGFPDITALSAATTAQRQEIGRTIESVIAQYEPRLHDVRVHVVEPKEHEVQMVRFKIEARLAAESHIAVAFATVLELATGHTSVEPGEN